MAYDPLSRSVSTSGGQHERSVSTSGRSARAGRQHERAVSGNGDGVLGVCPS